MSEAPESIRRVLPRGRNALDRDEVAASQKGRLLEAMLDLVVERGFADVRVSDLIARAGVAKPTFYDHFGSKLACFVALIDQIVGEMMVAIAAPLDPEGTSEERIEQGLTALVEYVASDAKRASVMFVEAASAGRAAVDRVDEAHELLAKFYESLREESRLAHPEVPPLSHARARAIVGAINEPIASALRTGDPREVLQLRDELIDVVTLLAVGHHAA